MLVVLFDNDVFFETVAPPVEDEMLLPGETVPQLVLGELVEHVELLMNGAGAGRTADAFDQVGLLRGAWLAELKKRFYRRFVEDRPLTVLRRRGEAAVAEKMAGAAELYRRIGENREPASIEICDRCRF